MQSVTTEKEQQFSPIVNSADAGQHSLIVARDDDQLFRLAAWVSGLDAFLSCGGTLFVERTNTSVQTDYLRELRLARAALQRCSQLTFSIVTSSADLPEKSVISREELREFSSALRRPLLLAEGLNRSNSLEMNEWQAWNKAFVDNFRFVSAYPKLVAYADSGGVEQLPDVLRGPSNESSRHDLEMILPRFGRILRLLSIVGEMLEKDEPLKPSLLIFAKVSEMTKDLIAHLNRRVERLSEEDGVFMNALDGASYMASIELKKVLQYELSGLTSIRPATSVYARIEAAHALLTESFQHILTGFAREVEPQTDVFALFPSFGIKLERSIKLRQELHGIIQQVKKTELDPEKPNIDEMNKALLKYMDEAFSFLFYKDTETFERFVDEILVTKQKNDLVPILHRFGAYLETLFAQVNMRAVLEKYPFASQN